MHAVARHRRNNGACAGGSGKDVGSPDDAGGSVRQGVEPVVVLGPQRFTNGCIGSRHDVDEVDRLVSSDGVPDLRNDRRHVRLVLRQRSIIGVVVRPCSDERPVELSGSKIRSIPTIR